MVFRRCISTICLVFFLTIGLLGCHKTPDETVIRQHIEAGAAAAEKSDVSGLDAIITDDFQGNDGQVNKQALLGILRVQHMIHQNPHVLVGPLTVEEQGGRYMVNFNVTLASGGSVIPDHMGGYNVKTAWRKEDGDWRCYWAVWDQ